MDFVAWMIYYSLIWPSLLVRSDGALHGNGPCDLIYNILLHWRQHLRYDLGLEFSGAMTYLIFLILFERSLLLLNM